MTDSNLLSPDLLHGIGVFLVALGVLMVAAHTSILALAAVRTNLAASTRLFAPLLVAALLGTWLAWAVLAVREPVVVPAPTPAGLRAFQRPVLLLKMVAIFAACIVTLYASKTMRALNAATPPEWLIAVQTYRVGGAIFLPFLAAGALPARFALPAGIGDMLTGIAAPVVALLVARKRPGAYAWAVAWNLFGILDLVAAPISSVLSHATNVGRFPLVLVPLFLGPPLGILTHIYSLRNLAVNSRKDL